MFNLLIADDEPLMRRGVRKLIDLSDLEIKNIFEAETGEEALQIFEEFRPEIVLLDINMPIKIGVEDYILKPISKSDISEIIAKLVYLVRQDRKNMETEKVLQKILERETVEIGETKSNYRMLIQTIMENNYTDSEFSLGVLSDELALSQGYLSIMFKKIFGIPFQDYLLQKRMEKAKILLLTSKLKNYEIAEQIGFEDVNYFGMKFKKYYGLSPKQYKEKVVQNEDN